MGWTKEVGGQTQGEERNGERSQYPNYASDRQWFHYNIEMTLPCWHHSQVKVALRTPGDGDFSAAYSKD